MSLFKERKYKEAIDAFHSVLETEPDNADIYNNLGVAYSCLANFEQAENYYVKATKDANDNKCVAIRKKYEFRKPFGEKIEKVKSIINIYSPDNIWVSGYQDCITLSDTDSKIIEKVLNLINAQKTDDNCKFTLIVKQAEEPKQKNDELENE